MPLRNNYRYWIPAFAGMTEMSFIYGEYSNQLRRFIEVTWIHSRVGGNDGGLRNINF